MDLEKETISAENSNSSPTPAGNSPAKADQHHI
jgi:hypothetical protein